MNTTEVIWLFVGVPAVLGLGIKLGTVFERNWWMTAAMGMPVVTPNGSIFYVLSRERYNQLRGDDTADAAGTDREKMQAVQVDKIIKSVLS
jgi:hypothetical protein